MARRDKVGRNDPCPWIKRLQGQNPPPLLTTAELLLAMGTLVTLQAEEQKPADVVDRFEQELKPALVADIRARCIEWAQEAESHEERLTWADLGMAIDASFGVMVLAFLANPRHRPVSLSDEEDRVLESIDPSVADATLAYSPYVAWLREQGESARAQQVEEALHIIEGARRRVPG